MNEEETYYRRVQKYTFGVSTTSATINLPNMKGFISLPGSDAIGTPADLTVTVLDPTGITSSISLASWDKNDPSNNLTDNTGYAGLGILEDNSMNQGAVIAPWTFYPYIITKASAVYGDTPQSNCTIYALL